VPDFTGKTAIITGGGSGLGRAMAEHLASLGAMTVLAGRRPEPLAEGVSRIESSGGRAVAVQTDVRDPEQVKRLVEFVVTNHGRVD